MSYGRASYGAAGPKKIVLMLTPADEKLTRRDSALPGLATLLDTEAFAASLLKALPGLEAGRIQPVYARYKPRTSCLVGWTAIVSGRPVNLYAVTYNPQNEIKLIKARKRALKPYPSGQKTIVLEDCSLVIHIFPDDKELKALGKLTQAETRARIFGAMAPGIPWFKECSFQELAYKPERRYVAKLCKGERLCAALKVYTESGYPAAKSAACVFSSKWPLRVPALWGYSDTYRMLLFEWLPGLRLDRVIAEPSWDYRILMQIGAALAGLHTCPADNLPLITRQAQVKSLSESAKGIAALSGDSAKQAFELAGELADFLLNAPPVCASVHGDFYAKQVLLDGKDVFILDLDRAARGDPALDLGSFNAYLEQRVIYGALSSQRKEELWQELLSGYHFNDSSVYKRVPGYTALGLLRRSVEPFRYREVDWPKRIEQFLLRARDCLKTPKIAYSGSPAETPAIVTDSLGAFGDARMPFLKSALAPERALAEIRRCLLSIDEQVPDTQLTQLKAIRVVRYKPGRRCLIEYELTQDNPSRTVTLMGKARASGLDLSVYQLQLALWDKGFSVDSLDGISVPQPAGIIPEFHMWLYRKVSGVPVTQLLPGERGLYLARRIAQAARKVHTSNVTTNKCHTISDEIAILYERLPLVSAIKPAIKERITRLLKACGEAAGRIPIAVSTGIYRDFYADQILADAQRLYLLDLDLYCQGDPALDIGNFIGHIKELSLREYGDADALFDREEALREEFLRLSGQQFRAGIEIYTTLTLARHIYLSTQFTERQSITEQLLELCERRLEIN